MSLGQYYNRAVFIPCFIVISGFLLFTVYDLIRGSGKDYKSEWLTAESLDLYTFLLVFLHCVILSVLCTTIFLNEFPKMRCNPLFRTLSWFLLPFIYMGVLFYSALKSIYHGHEVLSTLLIVLWLTLPFVVSLTSAFIKFRHETKKKGAIA
jgi:hypothetical protein